MLEKGRISAFQMGIMMYPTVIATAIIALPSTMGKYAKNDLWPSPIWASFVGFLTVYIVIKLNAFYPKQSLVQYSEHIVGQIIGKILGFIFVFYIMHSTGQEVRIYCGAFSSQNAD